MLREELGFDGLVVTDDLNSRSNLRGASIPRAAVEALNAGADLLLVTGQVSTEGDLDAVSEAIVTAVKTGVVQPERLITAATKVAAAVSRAIGTQA
jgi:beta-N-acetylhexosaminidase